MAMSYTSLTGNKGVSGSIMNWVSYSKLDIPVIVDEAQALIYTYLRVREMMSKMSFQIPQFGAAAALPTGFLDPIGRIQVPTVNVDLAHKDAGFVMRSRNFNELTGALGTNPFTTTAGSSKFSVNLPGNGFAQESTITFSGATSANGINFNGTFDISSVTDTDDFVCDTLTQTATGSGFDGGAAVNYICDSLQGVFPRWFGIWDEAIHFDGSMPQAYTMHLLYYRSLPLLSSSNQTNFLTTRYPQLMRVACQGSAADFMKDSGEYQKCLTRMQAMIQDIRIDNDGQYRGMELDTENP